ncbi:regulator of chromosome condensation 1/beta-lactamase-inhibitor protein II [Hypoxylon argillaceum]|nr:regulator of chromosome condensation 1/beta-lactamase-inhibitor protein II [Hypoxylon argillaceum]KAI1150551.1 regulator of chromosome condensation 1/beta-lactamase-inhibitor protein II [Nemania diffusa]
MDGLFALGSNGSGQLGLGHKEDVSVPKQVEFSQTLHDDPITQVAAGGNHTILITSSGKAYWSGDSSNGCCGMAEMEEDARPIFRKFCLSSSANIGPIMYAACTWDTTILVAGDENSQATQLYSCGATNSVGGEPVPMSDFPPDGTAVTSLAAGFRHVVVVLSNGDVYGWGNGKKGQLGQIANVDTRGVVTSPQKISGIPFKVARAVCCQHTTCLIAEPGDGRILVLGADKWDLKSHAPAEVPSWKTITASWGGIYILKRDGMLVAWGRGDHGQLPPPGLPELSHVAAGSEHIVALTQAGDVLTWGWGEHGNCGPHTDEKFGDVKGRWNVLASLKNLPEGSSITAIGAGCATSWINIMTEGIFL